MNKKMPKYKLIPLRIPAGWKIIINNICELDPNNLEQDNNLWMTFTEDLLNVKHDRKNVVVDIGWYPANNPSGTYRLSVVQDDDWETPIEVLRTRSNEELVEKLEFYLWNYC